MSGRLFAMVLLFTASACTRPNPAYCESSGECPAGGTCDLARHSCSGAEVVDAAVDGPLPPVDAESCFTAGCADPAKGVCDTERGSCRACAPLDAGEDECAGRSDGKEVCAEGECVTCLANTDCTPEMPRCVAGALPSENHCDVCHKDQDCWADGQLGICLVDQCLRHEDVFEVKPDGELREVSSALGKVKETGPHVIVVHPGTYPPFVVDGLTVVIIGTGSSIPIIDGGESVATVIDVKGAADVTLRGLEISGAHAADNGAVISCQNNKASLTLRHVDVHRGYYGVLAKYAKSLSVTGSAIRDTRIAIAAGEQFEIANNLIYDGRSATANPSTFAIHLGDSGTSRVFRHNTIVSIPGPAVYCGGMTGRLVASNLLYGVNYVTDDCIALGGSIAGETALECLTRLPDDSPWSGWHHIPMADTPCVNAGAPDAMNPLLFDFDGQERDDQPDVGADELDRP